MKVPLAPGLLAVLTIIGCFHAADDGAGESGGTGSTGTDASASSASTATASGGGTSSSGTAGTTDATAGSTSDATGSTGPDVGTTGDDAESSSVGSEASSSTGASPACGDGMIDEGEECDDGNRADIDECKNDCTLPFCGDGVTSRNEQCDDANAVEHDGCDAQCFVEDFCTDFEGFVCPSGATQWCLDDPPDCGASAHAIIACEVCNGPDATCQAFQDVTGCNEADGVVDTSDGCPVQLNFVHEPDICNLGAVVDECGGGQAGSWCG